MGIRYEADIEADGEEGIARNILAKRARLDQNKGIDEKMRREKLIAKR